MPCVSSWAQRERERERERESESESERERERENLDHLMPCGSHGHTEENWIIH